MSQQVPDGTSISLVQFQKQSARRRRVITMVKAFLQRGINAGIPKRFLRIKRDQFADMLCGNFHDNPASFADQIYGDSQMLFKKPYILIDGGGMEDRKLAGFALLFRMITCNKEGLYQDCSDMVHRFQASMKTAFNKSEYAESLKSHDVLFIGEFRNNPKLFSPHLDTGSFFDEVLGRRYDLLRPTIISLGAPINLSNIKDLNRIQQGDGSKDTDCGHYLEAISKMEYAALRIRVKVGRNGRTTKNS